jgi:hypothetical protein
MVYISYHITTIKKIKMINLTYMISISNSVFIRVLCDNMNTTRYLAYVLIFFKINLTCSIFTTYQELLTCELIGCIMTCDHSLKGYT